MQQWACLDCSTDPYPKASIGFLFIFGEETYCYSMVGDVLHVWFSLAFATKRGRIEVSTNNTQRTWLQIIS